MQNTKDHLLKYGPRKSQLSSNPIRRKEEKDFIIELKARNETLVLEQKRLQSRLKAASVSIKKYKQEIESLTRRRAGKMLSSIPIDKKQFLSGCRQSVNFEEKENVSSYTSPDEYDLANLKKQLTTARDEMEKLKIENKNLRTTIHDLYDNRRSFGEDHFKEILDHSNRHDSMELEFRNLEAASIAQMRVQQEMRQKLDHCNEYIVSLQSKLEAIGSAHTQEQGNDKMTELLRENKMLEEKLAKLCQLPFLKDENKSIEEENYINEIEELEHEIDCYTEQVHVLSTDNNTLRHEMEAMEQKFRDLLQERNELLEHANAAKIETRVLEVQTHQKEGREIAAQTESVVDCSDKSVNTIESSSQEEHLHEIKELKSTVNELRIIEAFKSQKISNIKQKIECEMCSSNPVLSLEPDETLLYITVKDASIFMWDKGFQGKSFVVLDILDFESQVSHLVEGFQPQYNFKCAFKLKVRWFLFDQLEKGTAWVELYQTVNDVVTLIGKTRIKTETLMTSQEDHQTISLDSPDSRTVGSIDIHMYLLDNLSSLQGLSI